MATVTIQLIFGVLNVGLPLMGLALAATALFLLYLHRCSTRLAKAAYEQPSSRTLPPEDFLAHRQTILQSPPVSRRPGRIPESK